MQQNIGTNRNQPEPTGNQLVPTGTDTQRVIYTVTVTVAPETKPRFKPWEFSDREQAVNYAYGFFGDDPLDVVCTYIGGSASELRYASRQVHEAVGLTVKIESLRIEAVA